MLHVFTGFYENPQTSCQKTDLASLTVATCATSEVLQSSHLFPNTEIKRSLALLCETVSFLPLWVALEQNHFAAQG